MLESAKLSMSDETDNRPGESGKTQNTDKMKTYIVSQTFETLGDPCRSEYTRKRDAERAANLLRRDIAEMVAGWETPDAYPTQRTGYTNEIEAWESAAETAGVEYDDNGERTANSPETYGREAGREIAEAAVGIEIEEQ